MFESYELVEFCEKAIGHPYWYGTCWYPCTTSLLNSKTKQYPKHYTSGRMAKYKQDIAAGKIACDCVGLIKGFFWTNGGKSANKYASNNCPDTSANGLLSYIKKMGMPNGTITNIPDVPGVAVFMDGHVGVYVGNGKVAEARGFAYGVVKTDLKKRPWKNWGYLPTNMLRYGSIPTPAPAKPRVLKKTSPVMKGTDVKEVQTQLLNLGYDLGKWGADGEYGTATETAVKAFQTANGLKADGEVGENTRAALAKYEKRKVQIVGGNCNVRTESNVTGTVIGVAHEGETYDFANEISNSGWHKIDFNGIIGWVSGKYSKLI